MRTITDLPTMQKISKFLFVKGADGGHVFEFYVGDLLHSFIWHAIYFSAPYCNVAFR